MGDLFSLLLIYIGLLLCIYRSPSTRCPRPSSATTSTRCCAPPTATTSSPTRPSCPTCSTTRSSSPSVCTSTSSTRSTCWRTTPSSRNSSSASATATCSTTCTTGDAHPSSPARWASCSSELSAGRQGAPSGHPGRCRRPRAPAPTSRDTGHLTRRSSHSRAAHTPHPINHRTVCWSSGRRGDRRSAAWSDASPDLHTRPPTRPTRPHSTVHVSRFDKSEFDSTLDIVARSLKLTTLVPCPPFSATRNSRGEHHRVRLCGDSYRPTLLRHTSIAPT